MSKSDTPFLDGLCNALALASLIASREEALKRKAQPKVRRTRTTRQIYDAKRGKIITLCTESESVTSNQ